MAVFTSFWRLALVAVLSAAAISCIYAAAVELPPDEVDLVGLLEEGVIDTFQYEQLLIYYALPMSVPQGELGLLARIFPDIEDLLPAAEALGGYRPFDNRQIQRLFGDFPVLADVAPILRFNVSASERPANGEVVIGINRSSIGELRGHRVRFGYKSPRVSAEGSVAFSDSGAMWRTRRVDVSLPGTAGVQVGNFARPVPGELFFGRFSPLDAAKTDGGDADDADGDSRVGGGAVVENWLYGGSNTWNGAAVSVREMPNMRAVGASAFYHIRGDESGAGGAVDLRMGTRVRVNAAITAFAGGDDVDTLIYTAHLYAEYRDRAWRSILEAGLPLGQDNVVPALSYRLNYRVGESSAGYHLVSYPANFAAPSSGLKRRVLSEVGERGASLSSSVRKHALRMTVPIFAPVSAVSNIKFTPEIDFSEHEGMIKRVQGRADVRARVNSSVDVALRHTARVFPAGTDSVLHTTYASLKLQTDYPVAISLTGQSVYGFYRNPRNTYTFELTYTGLPNTVITPFVRGRHVTEHQYMFGLKTELHLYRKTWTGITLEVPVNAKGVGNVYVRGASSYAF